MMIVLKSALAHQGASCLIGNINYLMAPSVSAFYTVQGGFPKDQIKLIKNFLKARFCGWERYQFRVDWKTFSVSSCSPKPSTDSETYGNGLIQLTQRSFCLDSTEDNCDDVTVCKVVSYTNNLRQEQFYVPLDRTKNTSRD